MLRAISRWSMPISPNRASVTWFLRYFQASHCLRYGVTNLVSAVASRTRCFNRSAVLFPCTYIVISTLPLPTVECADVNEAVTTLNLENQINAYIIQLCNDVINLLKMGDIMVTDRTHLVEKCCIFYNLLLFKFAGNCMVIQLAIHCITKLFRAVTV